MISSDHGSVVSADFRTYPVKVLLIDDQAIVAEAVRRMIAEEKDIELVYCQDPSQAMRMAMEILPTVILQDLIMPEIDSVQADSARSLAEEIYRLAKAGASFDSLQRIYHDKNQERGAEQFPLDQLTQRAPLYADGLRGIGDNELAPLLKLDSPDPNRASWAIIRLTKRFPAGDVRFEDVRDQIRARLGNILGRQKQLERLRQATYVEIRRA